MSFPTATLGGKVEVPTPEGTVSLKVPAGSEDGKLLRIKGRGAPKLSGSGKGDVLARLRIEVPKRVEQEGARAARGAPEGERLTMGKHDHLLEEGPREAPAPETVGMHPQTLRIYENKGSCACSARRAARASTARRLDGCASSSG